MKVYVLGAATAAITLCGCMGTRTVTKTVEVEKKVYVRDEPIQALPPATWRSSFEAMLAGYPQLLSPSEFYQPVFDLSEKKVATVGKGATETDATEEALLRLCMSNHCDYIAAAQKISHRIPGKDGVRYEVHVTGFPATLKSVKKIPMKIYEEQKDGSLKEVEDEIRYIYNPSNGFWRSSIVPKGVTDEEVRKDLFSGPVPQGACPAVKAAFPAPAPGGIASVPAPGAPKPILVVPPKTSARVSPGVRQITLEKK